MTANSTSEKHRAIRVLAEKYGITMSNAARVFAGEANASVDRGFWDD